MAEKQKVRIKENSWLAAVASKKLGGGKVAIVWRHTIHLHQIRREEFLRAKWWVLHELKHVEQFETSGWLLFALKYFWESMLQGYEQNKYEKEARQAEGDERLLDKYVIT